MARTKRAQPVGLAKVSTGIAGLDEVLGGGLPRGRPTLVAGAAGCGKTLLSMQFLVEGVRRHGENGVFMAFEENERELTDNVRSLGFDLDHLAAKKKLYIDHVHVDGNDVQMSGDFDLEGLFVRLGCAIDAVGAKRVVLDTLETLFGGFEDQAIVRSELRRLFRWLKDRGVTAIITAERGDGPTLTRAGIEEYVSDCVISLDHRVDAQVSTRRLKVVKYRGTAHGTNEYPFTIDDRGLEVLPITSLGLAHEVSSKRISTGNGRLDAMLGGKGLFRGSSFLISGTPGAGKSTLAAGFVAATCARGERALYFALEESPGQIVRNVRSVGLDLAPFLESGLLHFHATRPTASNLEMHLAMAFRLIDERRPRVFVLDPSTSLFRAGTDGDSSAMLFRLIDHLKARGVTTLFTSLVSRSGPATVHDDGVSSVMDTWLALEGATRGGEQTRTLQVLKSRGMAHSHQVREYLLTRRGLEVLDVDLGPEVLTGSARVARDARIRAEARLRRNDVERRRVALERKRALVEAEVLALRAGLSSEEDDVRRADEDAEIQDGLRADELRDLAISRWADPLPVNGGRPSAARRRGRAAPS